MKRVIVVILAVLMLGFTMPKQSEAGGEWVPAAIIGGIIFGTVLSEAAHSRPAYHYGAHHPNYAFRPPITVYVNPRHINRPQCRQVYRGNPGHLHYRGLALPPPHQRHRPRR